MRARRIPKLPVLALALLLVASLAACQSEEGVGVLGKPGWGKTETGAVLGGAAGAATGAAIGSKSDNTGKGAIIGGATGAVIGGAIGRELEKRDVKKQQEEQQQQYQQNQNY
jgi:hypothetical protein